VTGSGHGIGKGIAIALGKEGANLSVYYLHSKDGAFETVAAVVVFFTSPTAGCISGQVIVVDGGLSLEDV
jgi:NAD(P)-dependent dehydrogenase (short-subunit alcohol dehydrogenase family)